MSRGRGRVESGILDALEYRKEGCAENFARWFIAANVALIPKALRSSVNRALRNLHLAGLIVDAGKTGSVKFWKLTEQAKKDHANEKARSRRRAAEQERMRERLREADAFEAFMPCNEKMERPKEVAQLIKMLGMCGSDYLGERDNAARQVEAIRRKLNLGWEEIFERWMQPQ